MGSGMNRKEAEELASKRSYRWAVNNIVTGKGIKFRKATMIKLHKLAEIADWLDRKTENSSEKPNNCETCRHYTLACDLFSEICKYEPKDEPQTDCPWK